METLNILKAKEALEAIQTLIFILMEKKKSKFIAYLKIEYPTLDKYPKSFE